MKNSIRVERAIKRMTQAQLAELIGVSRQTIVAIESEKYVPSTVLSLKIARVLDNRVDDSGHLVESD